LSHELKTFIEAAPDVQHQGAVIDGLTKIGKSVCHSLHLAAELVDGEGALCEVAELSVEQHGAGFTVVQELLLDAEPSSPSRDPVALVDDVQELGGDGVEEPRHNHVVHARPGWVNEDRGGAEDMVLQGKAAEDEEEMAAPLGVVGGLQVQNNRNQVFDVLDCSSLAVQAGNSPCFRGEGEVVAIHGEIVPGRVDAETLAESSGLLLQGVGLRALLIESGGGSTNTLLGGGGGLEEGGLLFELLAALGVGGAQGGGFVFQGLGGGEGFVAELGRGGGSSAARGGVAGHGD
jgi:hypothetical protein